jgi:hypothetical protein
MTNLRCEIARSIVDHYDFVNIGKIFKDSVQNVADRPLFVEGRNNQAQKMVVHDMKWKDGRMEDWGFVVRGAPDSCLLTSVFSILNSRSSPALVHTVLTAPTERTPSSASLTLVHNDLESCGPPQARFAVIVQHSQFEVWSPAFGVLFDF